MNWYLAKSLVKLREQLNAAFPERSKVSDGSIGDASHQSRKSDHDPNAKGCVTAIDVTNDTTPNELGGQKLADALYASKDKRIKYLIWNKQITNKVFGTGWKPYHGANPHQHHVHISVSADPKLYDDAGEWKLDFSSSETPKTSTVPAGKSSTVTTVFEELKKGVVNVGAVKSIQRMLVLLGYLRDTDGVFGKFTELAVRAFQGEYGLRQDGILGKLTAEKLTEVFNSKKK